MLWKPLNEEVELNKHQGWDMEIEKMLLMNVGSKDLTK